MRTPVRAARLALDARKWYTSKIAPRRYGDRLETKSQVELSGPGGGPLQVHSVLDVYLPAGNVERLSDAGLAALETLREEARRLAAPAAAIAAGVVDGVEYAEVPTEDAGEG